MIADWTIFDSILVWIVIGVIALFVVGELICIQLDRILAALQPPAQDKDLHPLQKPTSGWLYEAEEKARIAEEALTQALEGKREP